MTSPRLLSLALSACTMLACAAPPSKRPDTRPLRTGEEIAQESAASSAAFIAKYTLDVAKYASSLQPEGVEPTKEARPNPEPQAEPTPESQPSVQTQPADPDAPEAERAP
ncbi:MAG: hypothetical protein AAGI01_12295 [Myxococcota bacterium]